MLQFIHARYDDNQEVMSLIEVLRKWSKYETFNFLEIFQLQDECYFGTIFACVRRVESYRKTYGFKDEEEALTILIRLVKLDESVFKAYPEL